MSTHILLKKFNEIYKQTYQNTLKYIIIHCSNLEDVNDLLQDIYIEVYKNLQKKKQKEIINMDSYIIGIAKNILKKYYRFKYKANNIISINEQQEDKLVICLNEDIDLELDIITKENVEYIWKYLKNKDIRIAKIFYLYYCLDMKISDIAYEMQLKESATKNYIYRTIKELKNNLKEESGENVKK